MIVTNCKGPACPNRSQQFELTQMLTLPRHKGIHFCGTKCAEDFLLEEARKQNERLTTIVKNFGITPDPRPT